MNNKVILDYDQLNELVKAHRTLEQKIVTTIGSWDLLHIGHLRYLNKAKEFGDVLIVGVDSDSAIKGYKGKFRPIIPHKERIEMLGYQDCVDYITLIDDIDEKGNWEYRLIRAIKPDIFVCIEESYPEEQQNSIEKYAQQLKVLPRQAESASTTNIIENVIKAHLPDLNKMKKKILKKK